MDNKFKDFWMEKSKEEIINAYRECIKNGEVLLARIEKAVEYIHKNYYEVVYKTKGTMENDLLNILNGDNNE